MRRRFRFCPLDSLNWILMFPVILFVVMYVCAVLSLAARGIR